MSRPYGGGGGTSATLVSCVTGPVRALDATGDLDGYQLLPAARADLHRRAGHPDEAVVAYREALELVTNDAERRYLTRRLAQVTSARRP
jgi:RNA polymerase sigma-70 factor (ECF subfamily)